MNDDLDVIGTDGVGRGVQRGDALDGHRVRPDAVDLRAERGQKAGQVLHVRLRGRVQQPRAPLGHRGRHHRGLRPRDTGLVEEHLGAPEATRELEVIVGVVEGDPGAELAKGEQMGVEPAAADLVPARPG